MTSTNTPRFAVVGHPNKGKSSIVAALAQNDAIDISSRSGTTLRADPFEISIGDAAYTLIDTPGFQRPRRALEWLNRHATSADQRRQAIALFVSSDDCAKQFPDEVALLRPISEGAAILYVVDGSRPYNPDYEAEMEILRWCGQPSMALINPIESGDHIDTWQQALSQFFKVVRVFNPMLADRLRRDEILEAFSVIAPEWRTRIDLVRINYAQQDRRRIADAGQLLAETLERLCYYQLNQQTLSKSQAEKLKPVLKARYFAEMRAIESAAHSRLKELFDYRHLDSEIADLPIEGDLFDTEKWVVWGLDRKQLALTAGIAGAGTGAVVDAATAGTSLLLGATAGALLAGGSAWFGADKIANFKVMGLPLGGFEARQGPSANRNFPYVIAGRFLGLVEALQNRTHAQRGLLTIADATLQDKIDALGSRQRKALAAALHRLSSQKVVDDLASALGPLLAETPQTTPQ